MGEKYERCACGVLILRVRGADHWVRCHLQWPITREGAGMKRLLKDVMGSPGRKA
jgi:hypothetical protein